MTPPPTYPVTAVSALVKYRVFRTIETLGATQSDNGNDADCLPVPFPSKTGEGDRTGGFYTAAGADAWAASGWKSVMTMAATGHSTAQ